MKRSNNPDRKQKRRDEAAARQAKYEAMTDEQKRKHLLARGCSPYSKEAARLGGLA